LTDLTDLTSLPRPDLPDFPGLPGLLCYPRATEIAMTIGLRAGATLILAGFVTVSCGGVVDPSKNHVESFTDTLNPGGSWCKQVTVNNGGEYSIKITALSPTPTAVLFVGWFQDANCVNTFFSNYATLNTLAFSGAIYQKGTYSVGVADLGTLTVAQNVTITVSHP
jgi:hypothetical protein